MNSKNFNGAAHISNQISAKIQTMKKSKLILLLMLQFCIIFSVSVCIGQTHEWEDLFDGKTLDGWTPYSGRATYEVINGEIVGTAVPNSPNTFLCTDRVFGDFVLEFEVFLVHPELNSGVQFRSQVPEQEVIYWFRDNEGNPGKKVIPAKRLYGYQVEIATERLGTSGGVYDEGRRAFMIWVPTQGSAASRAFKEHQWNRYRIECIGPSIKTWINDIACADFEDAMTSQGIIGLQVHGVGPDETPYQVKWRNIRIMEK